MLSFKFKTLCFSFFSLMRYGLMSSSFVAVILLILFAIRELELAPFTGLAGRGC